MGKTEREALLEDRFYYQNLKSEAINLPTGDVRNIKMDIYTKIIDTINAALCGQTRATKKRIDQYLEDLRTKISYITDN